MDTFIVEASENLKKLKIGSSGRITTSNAINVSVKVERGKSMTLNFIC